MGFYATETPCLPRPEAGCDRPQETYLPPKNRVGGFSTSTPDRARRSAPQTLEPHRENAPTPTTTASGVRFYGYRYLNPELGRWLNRDPLGDKGSLANRTPSSASPQTRSTCPASKQWADYLRAHPELQRVAGTIEAMDGGRTSLMPNSPVAVSRPDEIHLYLFVNNAPGNNYDPLGLFTVPLPPVPGIPGVPFPINLLPPCSGPAGGQAGPQDGKCTFPGGDKLNKCYQDCCKAHDDCYTANGCNAWSWINGCGSASCNMCNVKVVACFAAVTLKNDPCCDKK